MQSSNSNSSANLANSIDTSLFVDIEISLQAEILSIAWNLFACSLDEFIPPLFCRVCAFRLYQRTSVMVEGAEAVSDYGSSPQFSNIDATSRGCRGGAYGVERLSEQPYYRLVAKSSGQLLASMSAPSCSSSCTTSSCPLLAAMCNAVSSQLSFSLMPAPSLSSN